MTQRAQRLLKGIALMAPAESLRCCPALSYTGCTVYVVFKKPLNHQAKRGWILKKAVRGDRASVNEQSYIKYCREEGRLTQSGSHQEGSIAARLVSNHA